MIRSDSINARKPGGAICIVLLTLASLVLPAARATAQAVPATCPRELGRADLIDHDFSVSSCELCGIGTVRIAVENPFERSREDIHFSDPATRSFIDTVMSVGDSLPICLIVTYQPDEIHRRHPARPLADRLAHDPRIQRIELGPLRDRELERLVESVGSILRRGEQPALAISSVECVLPRGESSTFRPTT